jgi:GT2 family glycosyltransferase
LDFRRRGDRWEWIRPAEEQVNQSKISISAILPTLNAADLTRRTVMRHLEGAATCDIPLEVIVVDDGSRESELEQLRALGSLGVRIIENKINRGRGGAINRGAEEALGNYLLILDCDCPPASTEFLRRHVEAIEQGADVSVGGLLGRGNDFWSRYQDLAVKRREGQFRAGNVYSFTSQNVLVAADSYRRVGGYDERYERYGFEDRDFYIRLAEAGAHLAYTPSAAVIHDDSGICMASLSRKMVEGGRHTARQFALSHPAQYAVLGYAALDVSQKPALAAIGRCISWALPWSVRLVDAAARRNVLPFRLLALIAKATVAASFVYGTAMSRLDTGS